MGDKTGRWLERVPGPRYVFATLPRDRPMKAKPDVVTAAVLVIGDEILSGRTKDKNIGYIADYLTAIGIDLKEVRVVSDDAVRNRARRSTACVQNTIMFSPLAESDRPTTTLRRIVLRKPSKSRWNCIPRRSRS